jgi:hypothetical protein
MNKRIVFISIVVSALCLSFQQKMRDINVSIQPTFKNENLVLNNVKYVTDKKDTVTISTLKFYISNVEVEFENGTSYKEPESYHLIDLENEKSLQFQLKNAPNLKIKQLAFNVGIDSTTNVSGNLEGDLDPALGMYWAWNSGYINMKLEGKSSSCKSVKKDFQFHIGGYLPKQNALHRIVLDFSKNTTNIQLKVDISKWLDEVVLKQINSIMIPGAKAIAMSELYKNMFTIN